MGVSSNCRISAALIAVLATPALAQTPRPAQPVFSTGQPPRWEPYGVVSVGRGGGQTTGVLAGGVHHFLTNPVTGLLGLAAEGYLRLPVSHGAAGEDAQPGARLLATSRAVGLSVGVDVSRRVEPIVSLRAAILRGGLLSHGTMVRGDWLPRRSEFALGISIPIAQPLAGRTRVLDTDADLPRPPRAPLRLSPVPRPAEAALTRVRYAATQILAYTNLYAEDTAIMRYGRSYNAAMSAYRDALSEAFSAAIPDSAAAAAATARARAGLLQQVILPFDSLFGQVAEGGIGGLTAAAQVSFVRWLRDSAAAGATQQTVAAAVHARWLEIVRAVHANLLAQWGDPRLVWLPLQLALTEREYDEQTEVDRLIERVIGRPFTDRNAITYLRSTDLPLEIARSILTTRDYHVLWTHDFTGRRDVTRELDDIGYTMVADAYLPALTAAAARYDSTGQLPVYIVMLDQFYYSKRDGRLWMDILEHPMDARIRLPGPNAERERHLRQRQAELRDAVSRSRRLQLEARQHGGAGWLRQVVKVHVNILLPSDFSFRSNRILPGLPFIPDNIQRDHRKVAFYDIRESDPYSGGMILTGVGIGEHYASATWEDRGYRVRGPAALEVRAAARRALMRNGIRADQLPEPLRVDERPHAADGYDGAEFVGRALQVHNEAGFGPKKSSVARAMLYSLAPPGSVIIVPDPLWVSETWAAMLAGAAARGCKVYIISPSLANGPNPQAPVVAMQHDVMLRLLDISRRLGPQIQAVGGALRVGLYTARAEVTDLEGRRREITDGLRRSPWIKDVIPFDSAALAVLNRATTQTEANGKTTTQLAHDSKPRAPQLHQKTQLIARPGAIAALVRQPGWDAMLADAMEVQVRQTTQFSEQIGSLKPDVDSGGAPAADAMLRGYEERLSESERKAVSFYFSVGTQNEDPRGIMQDGEATLVVSGVHAAVGLVDLYYVMARSTWVETPAEVERLLPRPHGLLARLARLMRSAL